MFAWLAKIWQRSQEPKFFQAYMHLYYECHECGRAISVWNGRDGSAPLLVACPFCKNGVMMHTKWELDRVEQDYRLKPGDYYFRSGTLQDAWKSAKRYSKREATQEEIERFVRDLMRDEGWAVLDRMPPYSLGIRA